MSIISPNCILDDLEQVASNAKKKKKNRQQQQTNKQKEKISSVKVFRQSIIIDYLSILYIALGGVSHFD